MQGNALESPLDKVVYVVNYKEFNGKDITNININTNITSIEGLKIDNEDKQFNMTFLVVGETTGK